ncbi:hypothetical protein ACNQVK_03210 [Mycobacterium sp. 134]
MRRTIGAIGDDEADVPGWATAQDPDVGNRMTDVLVNLFKLFGDAISGGA